MSDAACWTNVYQPTLFEEIQEEAKFRVQELEEKMTVLRQDVE